MGTRKRRAVRLLQRYVLNPPAWLAVRAGLVPGYVLVETTGRRTGKRRRTVVGMHTEDGAEHGRRAGWVRNAEAHPDVRVCMRRRWRPAKAVLLPDDDPEARLRAFGRRVHAGNVRRFGTDLLTVRFDV
jgi:deazaflavin-dependent oxidoreductase (nitroreductase family)